MTTRPDEFAVRQAEAGDVPALVGLEQQAFGAAGTDVYGEEYFRCWLEVNPEGLLVAEHGGRVVAYRYSQYCDFELADIARLTTHNAFTDDGFTRATHKPDGNSINGVTVCSIVPGAGRVLFQAIFEQLKRQGRRWYFGFSRIAGFDRYCKTLQDAGIDFAGLGERGERKVATWYACECARIAGGLVWPTVTSPIGLGLPAPEKPDPVLSKYLKHPGFGVAAVMADWMKDPPSRQYGVMVLFKNPAF